MKVTVIREQAENERETQEWILPWHTADPRLNAHYCMCLPGITMGTEQGIGPEHYQVWHSHLIKTKKSNKNKESTMETEACHSQSLLHLWVHTHTFL